MLAVLGMTAFTVGLLHAVAAQMPEIEDYYNRPQPQNTYVYANNGKTILAVLRGSQARVVVPSQEISPWLKNAIVSIEDKRFYEHGGIDLRGILRALWTDISRGGEVQGGSTITQQYVKNAYNGNAPTITRKLREAALAWQLEQVWSKDKILTAYLNTIYFGNGAYGVEEACRVYFHRNAASVNPAQAALLAAIPEDPTLYDPVDHPKEALARRNLVLYEMFVQHYLDWKQYQQALHFPMPRPQSVKLPPSESPVNPYFANYVADQLVARFGASAVFGGGLRVTTTLSPGLQLIAEKAIDSVLPPAIGPSAALVAIDTHTGHVLAMVGGRSYSQSQFNLATQGERQPGSAFKPFVLAAALRDGISPATTLVSAPITIDAGGRLWNVNNFEHESLGPVDLSTAIAYSDNTVFAQLTNIVGPASVVRAAHAMGITTPLQPYFSIGLGAEPATPLEMARAYATLADGGYRLDSSLFGNQPLVVASIKRADGSTLKDLTVPVGVPGLSGQNAAIEDQMLEGVVDYGTGVAAQLPGGYIVAGKTGTTENYGDAWFVGFTPGLVTAVWVGYPNKLVPMLTQFNDKPVEGGTYPALIWKAFMEKALRFLGIAPAPFPSATIPDSSPALVTFGDADGATSLALSNGNCLVSSTVEFFPGMAPTKVDDCPRDPVQVPDVLGSTLSAAQSLLAGQPLETTVHYRPASAGERLGVVVAQSPASGVLSAYSRVTLVLAHPLDGAIPSLIGMTPAQARARLVRQHMLLRDGPGQGQRIVAQSPPAGAAAAPGLAEKVTLAARKAG
jgi:penicillin-binding protein 1A